MLFKIIAIIILIMFYSVYVTKIILQKRKGIQTDQMAKGNKDKKLLFTETIMKIATYSVVIVEVLSIIFTSNYNSIVYSIIGSLVGILGVILFVMSVYTMKDSWRAGIAINEKTSIVVNGIYSYSRNPAFLGFDLVYIGILIMFFNIWLLIFSIFAIMMLHIQILQEEKYLPNIFGNDYIDYKKKVQRYIGRKK